MSRNTRARKSARKARTKRVLVPATHEWGEEAPLTAEERSRVLQRYSCMTHRGTTIGFKPLLTNGWVEARTPEELEDATGEILKERNGEPSN